MREGSGLRRLLRRPRGPGRAGQNSALMRRNLSPAYGCTRFLFFSQKNVGMLPT